MTFLSYFCQPDNDDENNHKYTRVTAKGELSQNYTELKLNWTEPRERKKK